MCCGSHEDYSAAYFPITTWPLQCNPILPLSCAPSVQSGLCVDLPSVEWIMMSSCELGPRPVYIHVASVCGFKHMRAILVYVASVTKFFYSFKKKLLYNTDQVFQMLYAWLFPYALAVMWKLIYGSEIEFSAMKMKSELSVSAGRRCMDVRPGCWNMLWILTKLWDD